VPRLFLGAVLLIIACGGAATLPAPPQPTVTRPAPTIDVSDMMGGFPAATFFVVTGDGVRAVALLNHATKFTVPTTGAVQVASGNGQIYIADENGTGTRLRWIEQATGTVLGTRVEPSRKLVATGIGHGALAVEPNTGRLLALYADGEKRTVEAYEPSSLRPLGKRFESLCGDRLLAGGDRVAVACLAAGELVVSDRGTKAAVLNAGLGPLVAAAMSADGTTLVGRDDGTLGWMHAQMHDIVKIDPFRTARLVADGIASPEPQKFAVALATTDREIGISETRSTQRYISLPATMLPTGGILAQGQFAYWTSGRAAMHIDLQQGFSETMITLNEGLLPGGVGQ
jgi:hypothetical protein